MVCAAVAETSWLWNGDQERDPSELVDPRVMGTSGSSLSASPTSPPSTPVSPPETSGRRLISEPRDAGTSAADNDQELEGSIRKRGRWAPGGRSFSLFHGRGSSRKGSVVSADGALTTPGGQQCDPQNTSGSQTLPPRNREGSGIFCGVLSKFTSTDLDAYESFDEETELSPTMLQATDYEARLSCSAGEYRLLPGYASALPCQNDRNPPPPPPLH